MTTRAKAGKARKLSEARLSKLIRNMRRDPPSWEGPMEPELVLQELESKLAASRKPRGRGRGQ